MTKSTASNLVHTYVAGASFNNIFGGTSPTQYGYIHHITHMTPNMLQRWPWMKNTWSLSTATGTIGYFKTLKEAKAEADRMWPGCTFKTPKQYRKEYAELF